MLAAEQALKYLQHLLSMTPSHPRTGDPALVLETGEKIYQDREAYIGKLNELLMTDPTLLLGNQEGRRLRDEISVRDMRWRDALTWARGELAKRRSAGQRARQFQRAICSSQ